MHRFAIKPTHPAKMRSGRRVLLIEDTARTSLGVIAESRGGLNRHQ
jgi:hypothetical protein